MLFVVFILIALVLLVGWDVLLDDDSAGTEASPPQPIIGMLARARP